MYLLSQIGCPSRLHRHSTCPPSPLRQKRSTGPLEKPACLEVEELDELIKIAKEMHRFLWAYRLYRQEVNKSGILGKPRVFYADLSVGQNLDASPDSSGMINPALGGSSLLDMSAYHSVWAMLLVHRHPLNTDKDPKVLFTHQTIYPRSGVDINSRWDSTAILQCDEGALVIAYGSSLPKTFYIHPRPSHFAGPKGTITSSTAHHHPFHDGNNGMSYEADEVARCIRDRKIESERMPWVESRVVQRWIDKVRKEGPTETAKLVGNGGQ
ncbi:hypothetical protein D1P53_005686 [Cryptococcus gattii VGV]|nr:hypothetical protein D1P53_005686 [Cryptococcus gattii VGV]